MKVYSLLFIFSLLYFSCSRKMKAVETNIIVISTIDTSINSYVTVTEFPNTFCANKEQWCSELTFKETDSLFTYSIYNRWGELVWQTNNPQQCWDGCNYKTNERLPSGIYFTIFDVVKKYGQGENERVRSTVTLIWGCF